MVTVPALPVRDGITSPGKNGVCRTLLLLVSCAPFVILTESVLHQNIPRIPLTGGFPPIAYRRSGSTKELALTKSVTAYCAGT